MKKESLWHKTVSVPAYSPLSEGLRTDVAVIGGGIAGILTAFELTRRGVRCTVLEAGRILSGQTGNTTAKITSQHGLIYDKLINTSGFEHARAYAGAKERAVADYGRLVRERGIDCEFKTLPSYVYSTKNAEYLKKEAESAASLGIAASFVTDVMLPFPTAGAVRFENQAQFHPLKFLTSLLPGLEIYENTEVLSAKGNRIKTNRGVVTAEKLVFATNFPPINFPGLYFAKMHRERSYVVALDGAPMLGGIYYGADEDGFSFRTAGNGLLLLGGAGHRTGENRRGGRYAALRTAAERFFPGSRVVYEWSAQDCMPADSVPYIGRYSKSEPNWYVATGFQKWGMTSAMVSAMLLSDLICGTKNPYEEVFSPGRKISGESVPQLVSDGARSAKSIAARVFYLPGKDFHEIAPGHAGIVWVGGHRRGVYREILPDGKTKLHVVSVKCPHLGCELAWNPDEKSWDCPCHGSRFDIDGNLLDGPSQTGIGISRKA